MCLFKKISFLKNISLIHYAETHREEKLCYSYCCKQFSYCNPLIFTKISFWKPFADTFWGKQYKSNQNHKVFSHNGLMSHMRTQSGGSVYIILGSVTTHSRRSVILWAMWGCSGESPINAAIMPRNSKGNLGSHLRTHSGEKSCQCNLCEKAIFQNSVIIHLKAQIGEKPYHCSQCDKTFA